MIRATFDHDPRLQMGTGPSGGRTIAGVAVPYGIPGRVSSGETVVFDPGSLDANARPVALRDHDRARPIGRVVHAEDDASRMTAAVRVSSTRDGDDALVLAADGVLAMFSVGVEPTDWTYDEAGVLHVHAGDWQELSLLTMGAYPTAAVTSVTATVPEPGGTMPTPVEPDPVDPDPVDPETPPDPVEAAPVPVPVAASIPMRARPAGDRRFDNVGIAHLSRLIAAAQVDVDAASTVRAALAAGGPIGRGAGIEAALADITLVGTNNVGALARPAYQAELVEIVSHGTPQIDALSQRDLQRGDYPNVSFLRWNPPPTVALYTPEKSAVPSTPVAITPDSAPVQTWAGGNDISQATLDLGSATFVEEYIRAAGVDYAKKSDTYAVTSLLAAATPATTVAGATFVDVVAALFGSLDVTEVPAGRMWLGCSWDQAGLIISTTRDNGPAFWDGNVSLAGFVPSATAGGLSVFVDPNYPAGTWMLGLSEAASWYDLPGSPFNLRAVNASNLGLDVVVYGYGALGVKFPGAIAKTTVPTGP